MFDAVILPLEVLLDCVLEEGLLLVVGFQNFLSMVPGGLLGLENLVPNGSLPELPVCEEPVQACLVGPVLGVLETLVELDGFLG